MQTKWRHLARTLKSDVRGQWARLKGRAHSGVCPICDGPTLFVIRGEWLRDQYLCQRCGSIPRWRALMYVLAETYPEWRSLSIHECSPGGPLSTKLAGECSGYLPTHFFPGVECGTVHNGFRCEDLMAQSFPNEQFDLVITSDVFEHLPDVRSASREITRTLRPGGAHIFTVPWYHWKTTLVRAVYENGSVRHIEPPDYHGNPIDASGSLVFTEWGSELPFFINEWTGLPITIHKLRDRLTGIAGEFREVFVMHKPRIDNV